MHKGDTVKLTKIRSIIDVADSYAPGYWCVGVLIADIIEGQPIQVAHTERQIRAGDYGEPNENGGVDSLGVFTSSPVWGIMGAIGDRRVYTECSTWSVKVIDPARRQVEGSTVSHPHDISITYSSDPGDMCYIASVDGHPALQAHGYTRAEALKEIEAAMQLAFYRSPYP